MLTTWLVLVSLITVAHAQELVFQQDFDDPNQIEDFWLENNPSAKRVVGTEDGAECHEGRCLRGNWYRDYLDPITGLRTVDAVACRYSYLDLDVPAYGITDEMFLDYWASVDSDAAKEYGAKWIWINGSYRIPGEYGNAFNHIILPPWGGWDTWRISNNNTSVGELGGSGTRSTLISENPCILTLRGNLEVDDWFQGRWHHFQLHVKLNTPASEANGIVRFWIDGCLILDVDDYKYRDHDDDLIANVVTPMMYGGGDPPPGPFGWQVDDIEVWDGLPEDAGAPSIADDPGDDPSGVPSIQSGCRAGTPPFGYVLFLLAFFLRDTRQRRQEKED